jgi:uncharacterized protein YjaG (DUF416 family)
MAIKYDEAAIIEQLERLPENLRVLFAFLVAVRLFPSYLAFHSQTGRGNADELRSILERLWADLNGDSMPREEVKQAVDRATDLVPKNDDGDEETQPLAEDAAAALTYALRTRLNGSAQEADWAARTAYEATDHIATKYLELSSIKRDDEQEILASAVVQDELSRQWRDLAELTDRSSDALTNVQLGELRTRSEREALVFSEDL